jgi:hypothetical protein
MSSDESQDREPGESFFGRRAIIGTAVVAVVVVVFVFMQLGKQAPRPTDSSSPGPQRVAEESELAEARDALSREPDQAACTLAVNKINSHLNRHTDLRPPSLSDKEQAKLRDVFGLAPAEMAEVESAAYTLLDAHYLDECLLFRDAARSLDAEEVGSDGKPLHPGPLDRASAAFAWVVRQVRPFDHGQEPVPPAYTLRRGWGNALERALVFLALLRQDAGPEKLRGCLLLVPGADKSAPQRLWACGVVVGDGKAVYLFDPRLGLPLPGPGGSGVATLGAAAKDPALLAQLDAGPENKYDVKPEQARTADGLAVFNISGLAPRMRYLQDTLLTKGLGAQLAEDPADLDRLVEAVKDSGATGLTVWKPGVSLLRRFLPVSEGGVDTPQPLPLRNVPGFTTPDDPTQIPMTRVRLYEWSLVPWEALPPQFNARAFPITVGLGQRVRDAFAIPFTAPVRDPHGARELVLRGRYNQAAPKLVTEDGELREHLALRAKATNLDHDVATWLQLARDAYVLQLKAQNAKDSLALADAHKQIELVWKQAKPVALLLFGASSGPRDAEVKYLLGLCMHEQAEQQQARLDLLARAGVPAAETDVKRCQDTWVDARGAWKRFADEFGAGLATPPARQNLARAEAMLGDWQAAEKTFGDTSGPMTPLEKLAALYNARQAKKHPATEKPTP